MSEPDYQLMADQVNFSMGTAYTATDMRQMVDRIVSPPKKLEPRDFAVTLYADQCVTVKWHDVASYAQPDRAFRVNPNMSSVDMLRQAVYDAQNRKGDIR